MKKSLSVVAFWWFVAFGVYGPVVIGPFYDASQCESVKAELLKFNSNVQTDTVDCWSDAGPTVPHMEKRN